MKTVKADQAGIREAVRVLKMGGVIAYPTETTYGLGCDPRNAKAVARIFKIKGRDTKKMVLLVAANVSQVKKVARFSPHAKRLAATFWPGPLTLVLPATEGKKDIAIRVSSDVFVHGLTSRFKFPIVSTSANRSGRTPCRSVRAIRKVFAGHQAPDLIIDGGTLPKRPPSTIARIKNDGTIEVLREGAIAANSLQPPS